MSDTGPKIHFHQGRRRFLISSASTLLVSVIDVKPLAAMPDNLQPLIRQVTDGAPLTAEGITLTLPQVAENGNSVPLKVSVDSPMTQTDHVTDIHIFASENPRPLVAHFFLNPQVGRAEVNTRIRLAASQQVIALATLSDGSHRWASAEVVVTRAACVDEM